MLPNCGKLSKNMETVSSYIHPLQLSNRLNVQWLLYPLVFLKHSVVAAAVLGEAAHRGPPAAPQHLSLTEATRRAPSPF